MATITDRSPLLAAAASPGGPPPPDGCCSLLRAVQKFGAKVTNLSAKFFKDPDTTRGVVFFAMGIFDARQHLGHPLAGYETIRSTLRLIADGIGSTKIIQRADLVLNQNDFWKNVDPRDGLRNMARISSKAAYFVYDFLGLVNVLEKLALVSQGVGNAVSKKAFGARLDSTRSFFGFLACTFALADLFQFAYWQRERGFTLDTFLEAGSNIGRMGSFVCGKTLTGSLFLVGSSVCSITKFTIRHW